MFGASTVSLLWPDDVPRITAEGYNRADLNLDSVTRALSINSRYERYVRGILLTPSYDPRVLTYRMDIIDDLLRSDTLTERLEIILDGLISLEHYMIEPQWQESELRRVAWRLSELENYVDCAAHLHAMLTESGAELRSEGLLRLRTMVDAIVQDEVFQNLTRELPDLLAQVRNIKSVTIGINLDDQLRPVEAALLSINTTKFKDTALSFLNVFRGKSKKGDSSGNLGPLHAVPLAERDHPLMQPLFKDLADVLDQTSRPIAQALRRYVQVSGRALVALEKEIAFYLGTVGLIRRMRACGLPMCRPEIAPMGERACAIRDLYNVNLALLLSDDHPNLRSEIVTNDAEFGENGRIFILTGPNRGGKTTFTQAVGLAHVLMQAGVFVPASSARISPVDGIFTHFAAEERPELEAGRLGEESQRLSEIFQHATRHSLILLNESLSSTSAGESLYLARDIVRVLRLLGVRAIFATHLHELAADAETINAETPGDSRVISVISLVNIDGQTARRTYKIVPGAPMGMSYAREIAERYGISFDQLTATLRARKAIPPAES